MPFINCQVAVALLAGSEIHVVQVCETSHGARKSVLKYDWEEFLPVARGEETSHCRMVLVETLPLSTQRINMSTFIRLLSEFWHEGRCHNLGQIQSQHATAFHQTVTTVWDIADNHGSVRCIRQIEPATPSTNDELGTLSSMTSVA